METIELFVTPQLRTGVERKTVTPMMLVSFIMVSLGSISTGPLEPTTCGARTAGTCESVVGQHSKRSQKQHSRRQKPDLQNKVLLTATRPPYANIWRSLPRFTLDSISTITSTPRPSVASWKTQSMFLSSTDWRCFVSSWSLPWSCRCIPPLCDWRPGERRYSEPASPRLGFLLCPKPSDPERGTSGTLPLPPEGGEGETATFSLMGSTKICSKDTSVNL